MQAFLHVDYVLALPGKAYQFLKFFPIIGREGIRVRLMEWVMHDDYYRFGLSIKEHGYYSIVPAFSHKARPLLEI